MRIFAIILMFSLFTLANVSTASAQDVEYRGTFVITKLNDPCLDDWASGDLAPSRFVPEGVGDNTFTGLSYFFTFFAENYSYFGPFKDLKKWAVVNGTFVGRSGGDFPASLKFDTVSPYRITEKTNFVTLSGRIKDFDGITGCDISFRAAYNRRIN